MIKNKELIELIKYSTKFQRLIFKFVAGFLILGFIVVVILLFTVPAEEPGDEQARLFVGAFSILFAAGAYWSYTFGQNMVAKVLDVLEHPETIEKIKSVRVHSKGITAHAIHFILKTDREVTFFRPAPKVGLNVTTQSTKARMLDLLEKEFPDIPIERGWRD